MGFKFLCAKILSIKIKQNEFVKYEVTPLDFVKIWSLFIAIKKKLQQIKIYNEQNKTTIINC